MPQAQGRQHVDFRVSRRGNQGVMASFDFLSTHSGGAPYFEATTPSSPGERPNVSQAAYFGFPPNHDLTRCREGIDAGCGFCAVKTGDIQVTTEKRLRHETARSEAFARVPFDTGGP